MKYIGIDVCKGEISTFDNTTAGIRKFIGTLPKDGSIHCIIEATGNYSCTCSMSPGLPSVWSRFNT